MWRCTPPNTPFLAKALVLATGAKWKKVGATGEDRYFGFGVSYCFHLRRIHVQRKKSGRGGGREHRPHRRPAPQEPGSGRHRHPPPRHLPGPAIPPGLPGQGEYPRALRYRGGGNYREGRPRHGLEAEERQGTALFRNSLRTACSWPWDSSPTRSWPPIWG